MKIDRKQFFDGYRAAWGALTQAQVDALEALLGFIEQDQAIPDVRWAAYMLATVKHETADTFAPIIERGPRTYFDKYEPGRRLAPRLGNTEPGDGFRYRGRGYVQLTGRANYRTMTAKVVCLEMRSLIDEPDLACDPRIAYEVMSYGMRYGLFTGKRLGDYLGASVTDYRNARRIINGTDKAELIAGYARDFERILRHALL